MEKSAMVNKLKKLLKKLNANKPFIHFHIALSQEEINHLNSIHVDSMSVYDNFGRLDDLENELDKFITSLNENNANFSRSIASFVSTFVHDVILGFEKETAWVSARASIATHYFDTPRWHTDGYYYPPYRGPQYKVVFTLKGATSLFNLLNLDLRQEFNWLQINSNDREKIANLLKMSASSSPIAQQQGTIYIVGTKDAAVHSEPPIHEERFFLSIVPGNHSEIQQLYNNLQPQK